MTSTLNDTLATLLPVGSVITGISAEYGDDFNFDFIILQSANDIIIESAHGDNSLMEVRGDLNAIVYLPVLEAYTAGRWIGNEYETTFVIRTAEGEASFIWLGYDMDVEARAC